VSNVAELRPPATPQPAYRFNVEYVSPDDAGRLLGTMKTQRRLRKGNLERLRRRIKEQGWRTLPHGIVIGTDGRLYDGQHRLELIRETGIGQWLVVCRDCPPEYYTTIDNAVSPKNLEDVLRAHGCPANLLSPAGVVVRLLWRRGRLPAEESEFGNRTLWPTNDEGLEVYLRDRRRIEEAADLAQRSREWCASPGTFAYVLYQGLGVAPERTREFSDAVRTGNNLGEGHPAALLRNTWMKEKAAGIVRYHADLATQASTALTKHIRGQRMLVWGRTEFGTGRMPPVGR
jgi:hypothetical protein